MKKKIIYNCPRCNYMTDRKSNLLTHLRKQKICKVVDGKTDIDREWFYNHIKSKKKISGNRSRSRKVVPTSYFVVKKMAIDILKITDQNKKDRTGKSLQFLLDCLFDKLFSDKANIFYKYKGANSVQWEDKTVSNRKFIIKILNEFIFYKDYKNSKYYPGPVAPRDETEKRKWNYNRKTWRIKNDRENLSFLKDKRNLDEIDKYFLNRYINLLKYYKCRNTNKAYRLPNMHTYKCKTVKNDLKLIENSREKPEPESDDDDEDSNIKALTKDVKRTKMILEILTGKDKKLISRMFQFEQFDYSNKVVANVYLSFKHTFDTSLCEKIYKSLYPTCEIDGDFESLFI